MAINNLTNLNRFRKEEQLVFLNSGQIPGIQSVNFGNNFGAFPVKHIGINKVILTSNSPQEGQVKINRMIIDGTDPFAPYVTGVSGFNLFVLKDKSNPLDNYGCTSGYIVNYNTRCGIGEIPISEVDVMSFGNIGCIPSGESNEVSRQFLNIPTSTTNYNLKVPGAGSVSITLNNDIVLNRVQSYNLSITADRKAIYALGSRYPIAVEINYPISIGFNFSCAVSNYSGMNVRDFPILPKTGNLILSINNFADNVNIQSFRFTGMQLISENVNNDTETSMNLNANYVGFLTRY